LPQPTTMIFIETVFLSLNFNIIYYKANRKETQTFLHPLHFEGRLQLG